MNGSWFIYFYNITLCSNPRVYDSIIIIINNYSFTGSIPHDISARQRVRTLRSVFNLGVLKFLLIWDDRSLHITPIATGIQLF